MPCLAEEPVRDGHRSKTVRGARRAVPRDRRLQMVLKISRVLSTSGRMRLMQNGRGRKPWGKGAKIRDFLRPESARSGGGGPRSASFPDRAARRSPRQRPSKESAAHHFFGYGGRWHSMDQELWRNFTDTPSPISTQKLGRRFPRGGGSAQKDCAGPRDGRAGTCGKVRPRPLIRLRSAVRGRRIGTVRRGRGCRASSSS